MIEPCNTKLIFSSKFVCITYFSGLCNFMISVLGISKGSTMSWGGAQFIAVWMIVNQVGQIVCGPLELERLERVHGPIMRWKNYQTNHTLGPKSSISWIQNSYTQPINSANLWSLIIQFLPWTNLLVYFWVGRII